MLYNLINWQSHRRTKTLFSYALKGSKNYELNDHLWKLYIEVGIISIYGLIINGLFTNILQVTTSFLIRYSESFSQPALHNLYLYLPVALGPCGNEQQD